MVVYTIAAAGTSAELQFWNMQAVEELGRPFRMELQMFSESADVAAGAMLGTGLTVTVAKPDGGNRYFHGLISRFGYVGKRGRYSVSTATLRPWLWFLTRTSDCRIFQNQTVPDILEKVFRDKNGFTDFRKSTQGTYRTWEYCVQYRESDFAFVSRLMEQEGIYYYFEHAAGKHTLVMADAPSAHKAIQGSKLPYRGGGDGRIGQDHISVWQCRHEIQTAKYVLQEYDYLKPSAGLETRSQVTRSHALASYEQYDYPGEYVAVGEGNAYAKVRIEELQARHHLVDAEGTSYDLSVGKKFTLAEYPREADNGEYLCIRSEYDVQAGEIESFNADSENRFDLKFVAIPAAQPFRTARTTPRPTIAGPQTAVVVGKQGEEIWTDAHGCIKVQFHWDREGVKDENSSCWVRVAQVWAGKTWGAMHIPRIGQEVIVEFLEGDPDRPIVTGRVYNNEQMPPYALPENATQSGLKSRSSKEGTGENFNELRFEDKKGEEQVYFHAEKNFDRVVENNDTLKVGFEKKDAGDQTIDIFNNQTVKIGCADAADGSQATEIFNNQTFKVGCPQAADGSQTIEIWKNRTETVKEGNETVTIDKGNRSITVSKGNDVHLISEGNREVKVTQGNDTLTISQGNLTVDISAGKCAITAAQSIELTVGASSIKIEPAKITLKSAEIAVSGDAKVAVDAATTQINGSGMVQIQGGMVKIN